MPMRSKTKGFLVTSFRQQIAMFDIKTKMLDRHILQYNAICIIIIDNRLLFSSKSSKH